MTEEELRIVGEKRREAYPSFDEVVIAMAEKLEGDSTKWDAVALARAAVKVAHPKT